MHKIFKLCGSPSEEYWQKTRLPLATSYKPQHPYTRCVTDTFKDFPPSALTLLDALLSIEPEERGTAASALSSRVRNKFFIDFCFLKFLYPNSQFLNNCIFLYGDSFISLVRIGPLNGPLIITFIITPYYLSDVEYQFSVIVTYQLLA